MSERADAVPRSNPQPWTTLMFRQPRLAALLALMLIAAGASALLAIGRQEDPTITNLFATVTTVLPGAAPARIEALVTEPIEEAMQGIAEVALITSESAPSVSIVQVELVATLDDAGIDAAWNDIRAALDTARTDLPIEAGRPDFSNDFDGAYSAIFALVPDATRGPDLATTARYADRLESALRAITGTGSVEVFGAPDEEIRVTVDPERLASLSLSAAALSQAIGAADAKVGAGRLHDDDRELTVEVAGELDGVARIRNIPLRGSDGRIVRVGDVARLAHTVLDPPSERALADGRDAILVAARLQSGLQIDVWMDDVDVALERVASALPDGLSLERVFDQSAYTAERLGSVAASMALGVALVITVLLVTLGLRAALIVAMVLPLVSLAAVATMNLVGLPIHQMSLTGLIVALGLLVDAAIVMTDEIRKRLADGRSRLTAVGESVSRLLAPLAASTITTVLSFMPLALLPGAAGDFVGSIAIAVIIMLLWSFAIAMTLTAAIAGWLLPAVEADDAAARHVTALSRGFSRAIGWTLRYPIASIALSLVLPVTGFVALPGLVQQFFPGVDRDQFQLEIELPSGASIAATTALARDIDARLATIDGIEQVSWVIGRSAPAFYYNLLSDRDRAPEYAQALIRSASPMATDRIVAELQRTLADRWPQVRVIVQGLVQGPPVPAPVELRFSGPDLEVLQRLGEKHRALLSALPTINVTRASLEPGAPTLTLDVDEDAARLAGLSLVDVARFIDATMDGAVAGSVQQADRSLPVRVVVDEARRGDLSGLLDLPLPVPAGSATAFQGMPLSAIATARLEPSLSSIARRDGQRINTVQGFIPHGLLPEQALADVRKALAEAELVLPPGYTLAFGGDSDARDDTARDLFAPLGIIVTLSLASVVASLGSFRLAGIALLVAGLSAGLAFVSLALFRYPFGIQALIGVIGSIGVSINAALILLSGLKADARAVAGDLHAMRNVVTGSARHIVSTTLTTFGGFLPLILAGGGFWPPFAMAIAGGVLLSTVVSFGFVAPMFRLVYSRGARADGRMARPSLVQA